MLCGVVISCMDSCMFWSYLCVKLLHSAHQSIPTKKYKRLDNSVSPERPFVVHKQFVSYSSSSPRTFLSRHWSASAPCLLTTRSQRTWLGKCLRIPLICSVLYPSYTNVAVSGVAQDNACSTSDTGFFSFPIKTAEDSTSRCRSVLFRTGSSNIWSKIPGAVLLLDWDESLQTITLAKLSPP